MKNKISIPIFSLLLMLSFGSVEQILACSPNTNATPICEMYGKSGGVFVGKIVSIKEVKKKNVGIIYDITFHVQETFVGAEKDSDVAVFLSGSTPEVRRLRMYESYLVYGSGYGKRKRFSIDSGTRTKHICEADEDLEYLRQLSKKKDGINISGKINLKTRSSLEKDNTQPFSGAILTVKKTDEKNLSFQAVTDLNGNYEFIGLPPGSYKISIGFSKENKNFRDKYSISTSGGSIIKTTNKGCSKQDFTIEPNGKISGKVIDADGNPVKNTIVEIISIFVPNPDYYEGNESSETDSNGEFNSDEIPPGLYTISVNYSNPPENDSPFPTTFYPNAKNREQAQVFEMTLGGNIKNLVFKLPQKLKKIDISGSVFWKDGTPAGGVTVYIKERLHDVCCVNDEVVTNSKGQFKIQGFEGREYRVWAVGKNQSTKEKGYGASSPFFLNHKTQPISFVLDKTKSWLDNI